MRMLLPILICILAMLPRQFCTCLHAEEHRQEIPHSHTEHEGEPLPHEHDDGCPMLEALPPAIVTAIQTAPAIEANVDLLSILDAETTAKSVTSNIQKKSIDSSWVALRPSIRILQCSLLI